MRSDWREDGRPVSALKNAATVGICVLVFLLPIQAVALGGTPSVSAGGGPAANLDCLNEDQDEISDQIDEFAGQTIDILPDSVRTRVVGEQLSIVIGGTTYFAATVSESGTVESVRARQAENPTVIVRTECETIATIRDAESPSTSLERSISRGDITLQGTSTTSDAAASYGTKGVQAYHITQSSETGGVQEGTRGFTNGLVYD